MPPSTSEFQHIDQQHSTEIQTVSSRNPCPLCNGEYQCYTFGDRVGCASLFEAPKGWDKVKQDKNGRWIFAPAGSRSSAKKGKAQRQTKKSKSLLPVADDVLPLARIHRTDDEFPLWEETGSRSATAYEKQVEYFYPCPETGEPLGKVVRKQWSDRRAVYGKNCDQTKEIRPWHWATATESMKRDGVTDWWTDRGKGKKKWGLYRQLEIESEIAAGEEIPVLFYVAGEQAVESARKLGLWAITNQGGEGSFVKQIVDFVSQCAKPKLLVIWGDNDPTGRGTSAKLFAASLKAGIPTVNLAPDEILSDVPSDLDTSKWDITNVLEESGMSQDEIIRKLEEQIRQQLSEEKPDSTFDEDFRYEAFGDDAPKVVKIPPADKLAKQIAEDYQDKLKFNNETAQWMRYEAEFPGVWTPETNEFMEAVVSTVLDSLGIEGYDQNAYVVNVLKKLRHKLIERKWIERPANELIPFENGVLEVATGKLLSHSPGYRLTWCIPRQHNPLAGDWGLINDYLDALSQGNHKLKDIYLCFANAVLKGRADLQKFLHLIGLGGSGKGTYARLITDLIGQENILSTTLDDWCNNRFETANGYRKRLVVFWDEDRAMDKIGKFLSLTGGDWIRGEEKNRKAFQYKFNGLCLVLSNKPIFVGSAASRIARRAITVPCNNQPAKTKIRDLNSEFQGQLDAFTNYVLSLPDEKVTQVLKGLADTPECKAEFWENRMRVDAIAAWVNEWIIQDATASTQLGMNKDEAMDREPTTLYGSYALFCRQAGMSTKSHVNFSSDLVELCNTLLGWEVEKRHTKIGKVITGLRLRSSPVDDHIPTHDAALQCAAPNKQVTGYGLGDGLGDGLYPLQDKGFSEGDGLDPIQREKQNEKNPKQDDPDSCGNENYENYDGGVTTEPSPTLEVLENQAFQTVTSIVTQTVTEGQCEPSLTPEPSPLPQKPSIEVADSTTGEEASAPTMPVQNASQATKAVADDQTPQQSAEQLRSTSTDKSKDAIAPLENTAGSADQELLERLQFQELYIQAASEFKRLGWTKERSVQHVQKTYRMVGGTHLSVEQLRHLLSYLKALPTPPAE